jgi:hypothetical protein
MPRPPWRATLWVTLAVVLAHFALLVLAPMSAGPKPSPLEARFSTRTIVIAPKPSAEPPRATATVAKPSAATPAPAPKAKRPRAISPPRPRKPPKPRPPPPEPVPQPMPAVEPDPAPAPTPTVDDAPTSAPAPEPGAAATPADADSAPAPGAAAAGAAGTGAAGADAASGSGSGATVTGPQSLRVPGSVKLAYTVTGQQGVQPLQGVFGQVDWLQDGNNYDATLTLKLLFKTLRAQRSSGTIGALGIAPDRFSDKRKSELTSQFVRTEGKVVFSNNKPSVPLLVGAQDRLSVWFQLGAMLAGDPSRFPAGRTISIQTVGASDADIEVFKVGDEETLSLPAGEVTARKLTRLPQREHDDKIELWLAPDLGYLPVRIKLTQEKGDFADMQLREQLPLRPAS